MLERDLLVPNITFIIGNGFDLQVGLKTRYIDFYKVYCEPKAGDSALLRKFKRDILLDGEQGWLNWSDFELGMGQQASEFSSADDFLFCLDDFVVQFNTYLKNMCEHIDWDSVNDNMTNEFVRSITAFTSLIKSVPSEKISKTLTAAARQFTNYHFIQFNYTDVFDNLIRRSEGKLVPNGSLRRISTNAHVHGALGRNPIIGVDSVEQIVRADDPSFAEAIETVFVKPTYLKIMQSRNVNLPIPARKALAAIKNSNIICVFGASIGKTDKSWWKAVGDWLRSNGNFLVIFDVCGIENDGVSPLSFLNSENKLRSKENLIFNRIAELAEWTDEVKNSVRNRVVIELNSSIFNLQLPQKADD